MATDLVGERWNDYAVESLGEGICGNEPESNGEECALQARNSETIVRPHYLNLHPPEEGEQLFQIAPDLPELTALISEESPLQKQGLLQAI